ncbi:hypothetical protein [Micrococcus sp.]|uniref:hypothetical protein n=1 Tax=Micrococcus sp. TaxID=1271 RepID=UPI002A91B833|nr:hypothetical protein [Micrococcus sp.]MDY6054372.1 hypothetical protein [Micrococcus sp.]
MSAQPSPQAVDAATELASIRADIDRLTARRTDLEKVLIHELGNGTHTVAGLKVQISTPRQLDKKLFADTFPPATRPDLYVFEPTLNMDAVKDQFAPAQLDEFKTDGTTRLTLR